MDRGFQEYTWFPRERKAVKVFGTGLADVLVSLTPAEQPTTRGLSDLAIQWFNTNGKNDSFFWVHYFDPHAPGKPPAEYLPADLNGKGKSFGDTMQARIGNVARTADERKWIRSLYDSEVRYVDAEVGRLLDALRSAGIYDESLIVLTADHGEEFWDHDRFEHGHTLYNELIRVPLLIKVPGSHQSQPVTACVGTQAIMPTVLKVCGLTPGSTEGLLSPLMQDGQAAPAAEPIFSGGMLFHDYAESVVFDRFKYIRLPASGHEMLFSLDNDPKEMNSLADSDAANLEKGRQLLNAYIDAAPGTAEKVGIKFDAKDRIDERAIQSLQALGYL
jgi:arylsulfatase A-like enzyme